MKELATRIIKDYCETYGIKASDLVINRVIKKKRNGIHYDWMRMSLVYLLRRDFHLSLNTIADLTGYRNHTSVMMANKVMENYLNHKDPEIYPYWERLQEVYLGVMAA